MPTTHLQDALLDQLKTLARVSIPVPIEVRLAAASFILNILDHFESLSQFEHAVDQRGAQGMDDIAQEQLLLALSYEHDGLDRLLKAASDYQEDDGLYLQGIYKYKYRLFDDLLRSAPSHIQPCLLDQRGDVKHDVEDFCNVHHDEFKRCLTAAYNEPGPTDRYWKFIGLVSAINTRAGDHSKAILRNFIKTLADEHCAVDDLRRKALLGEVPQVGECSSRLRRLVIDLIIANYPSRLPRVKWVETFIELVDRNHQYTNELLARDLHAALLPMTFDCHTASQEDGLASVKRLLQYLTDRSIPVGAILVRVMRAQLESALSPDIKAGLPDQEASQALGVDDLALSEPAIIRALLSCPPSPDPSTWDMSIQVFAGALLQVIDLKRLDLPAYTDADLIQLYRFTGDSAFLRGLKSDHLRIDTLENDLGL